MNRSLLIACAAVLVLTAAGCDSKSGGEDRALAQRQAKEFTCPSAASVSLPLGKTVPTGHRGTVASQSVTCSYVGTSLDGASVIVSITFGVRKGELNQIAKATVDGRAVHKYPGVGDEALAVAGDAKDGPMLFAHSGNRVVTVVLDLNDRGGVRAAAAIARLFL